MRAIPMVAAPTLASVMVIRFTTCARSLRPLFAPTPDICHPAGVTNVRGYVWVALDKKKKPVIIAPAFPVDE